MHVIREREMPSHTVPNKSPARMLTHSLLSLPPILPPLLSPRNRQRLLKNVCFSVFMCVRRECASTEQKER
jgi:hypothetical protein